MSREIESLFEMEWGSVIVRVWRRHVDLDAAFCEEHTDIQKLLVAAQKEQWNLKDVIEVMSCLPEINAVQLRHRSEVGLPKRSVLLYPSWP